MDEKDITKPAPEAQTAPPRGVESKVFQKTGVDLLVRFHIVDKLAKIYDTNNDAFQEQGKLLFASLTAMLNEKDEPAYAQLVADLAAAGVEHVELEKISAEEIVPGLHQNTARMYFLSIVHLKESFARDQRKDPIKINTTRRLMQSIYNHIVEDEGFAHRLTKIKNHDADPP